VSVCVSARREFDTSQTRRSLMSTVAVDEGVCVCVGVCICVCVWARLVISDDKGV